MRFNLLNLKTYLTYEVVDVDWIKKTDGNSHTLRLVLKYEENGETKFVHRYANIQFGKQIRIGQIWRDDEGFRPKGIIKASLPLDLWKFPRELDKDLQNSAAFFSEEYSDRGIFEYENPERKSVLAGHSICTYLFETPLLINGNKVKFVTIPTYEIIRFFLFGANKYNEVLLGSDFHSKEERFTKIFNKEKSRTIVDTNGRERKTVQLRKSIADNNVRLAGDLAHIPEINRLASELISKYTSSSYPFRRVKLPAIEDIRIFDVGGKFVYDKKGNLGFSVHYFDSLEYGEKYHFTRDNDGRSTPTKKDSMKKIFGGKRKNRPKPGKKKKSKIDHNKAADNDMEAVKLTDYIKGFKYSERNLTGEKIQKLTQEYIADKKKPGEEKDVRGVGGASDKGESGTDIAPVDNDLDVGSDEITELKYWTSFPKIISLSLKNLEEYVVRASFLDENFVFSDTSTSSSTRKLFEVSDWIDFYFVELKVDSSFYYIIELNPDEYTVPTMMFWDELEKAKLGVESIEKFLKGYFESAGIPHLAANEFSNEKLIEYGKIKHQYYKRKTGYEVRYKHLEAIENQAKKLTDLIRKNEL